MNDDTFSGERAQRILDASTDLLTKWGYKKVTIEEIASAAGIGKGSIYLHWNTKDELFHAVLVRDSIGVIEDVAATIRKNAHEVLLHRTATACLAGIAKRPLTRALYMGDDKALGRLVRTGAPGLQEYRRHLKIMCQSYFECLADHRLVRTDCDSGLVMRAAEAMGRGMMMSYHFNCRTGQNETLQYMSEVLATTVRLAFEPARCAPPEIVESAAKTVLALFDEFLADHPEACFSGIDVGPLERKGLAGVENSGWRS